MSYSIKSNRQEYQIQIGGELSSAGATAVIYKVKGNDKIVFKEYTSDFLAKNDEKEIFKKLKYFISNHPSTALGSEEVIGETIHQLAWPKNLVFKNGNPSGFLMDKIDFNNSAQLNMLFNIKNRKKHQFTEDITWRLFVAENLARVYAELHQSNYLVIDTKPANIRVYKSVPGVALLDCDGFKLEGSSYSGQMITPDYIAPEAIGVSPENLGKEQDIFALSVIFFQLFNNGIHPFSGVLANNEVVPLQDRIKNRAYAYGKSKVALQEPSPFSLHHLFPDKLQEMFNDVFAHDVRPTAENWADLFSNLKKKQSLGTCSIGVHGNAFKRGCLTCAHEKLTNAPNLKKNTKQGSNTPSLDPNLFPKPSYPSPQKNTSKGGNGAFLLVAAILILIAIFVVENNTPSSSSVKNTAYKASEQNSANTVTDIYFPKISLAKQNSNVCEFKVKVFKNGIEEYGFYKSQTGKIVFFIKVKGSSNIHIRGVKSVSFDDSDRARNRFDMRFDSWPENNKRVYATDVTFIAPSLSKANNMYIFNKRESGRAAQRFIIPLEGIARLATTLSQCVS